MLQKLKTELNQVKEGYSKFKKEYKHIFKMKKEYKKSIENLSASIKREMDKTKPPFPLPELDLSALTMHFGCGNNTIDEHDIKNYKGEDISALLGWKYLYDSDSSNARTDGDWYEYSLEMTSPEGYVYSYEGETCLGNGEFEYAILK